jgi:hypothetical protein
MAISFCAMNDYFIIDVHWHTYKDSIKMLSVSIETVNDRPVSTNSVRKPAVHFHVPVVQGKVHAGRVSQPPLKGWCLITTISLLFQQVRAYQPA